MLQFLKFVLATIVGLILSFFLLIFIMAGIVAAASSDEPVQVKANSVLKLTLDKEIKDRAPQNPFEELNMPGFAGFESGIGLNDILASIRKAKTDDNIKGIYLQLNSVNGGMATVEEIRNALIDFKKSGKFIVSYSELYSEKAYYLASVADKIVLNPVGALEFNGLSSEVMFIKGTLDKLGIQPYIFKVGEFKSAVEPLVLTEMSEASRTQTQSFLNSINDYQLQQISQSLKKSVDELRLVSDSMKVRTPKDALTYGLVTDVDYYDNAEDFMRSKTDTKSDEEVNFVELSDYKKVKEDKEVGKNKIAVIYASGDIVSGEGENDNIGSDKLAKAIRKARLDKSIKAIVLRINSPGGSALASDVMWHEIVKTKGVKPIIASMSDVAASGGYYLAMACDTIVAHPTTITGSIGVFGVLADLSPFLKDKLGVTVDRVKTGKFSDVPSVTRPMSAYEKQAIQDEVERIYHDFTEKAAKGRKLSHEELKKYASGRVWSGIEAKERNLVDVFGGLEEAVKIAAERAGVAKSYRVRAFPEQKNFFEEMMGSLKTQATVYQTEKSLGEFYPAYNAWQKAGKYFGIQARMPFELVIE